MRSTPTPTARSSRIRSPADRRQHALIRRGRRQREARPRPVAVRDPHYPFRWIRALAVLFLIPWAVPALPGVLSFRCGASSTTCVRCSDSLGAVAGRQGSGLAQRAGRGHPDLGRCFPFTTCSCSPSRPPTICSSRACTWSTRRSATTCTRRRRNPSVRYFRHQITNSLVVAVWALVAVAAVAALGSFAMARMNFRFRRWVSGLTIFTSSSRYRSWPFRSSG